MKKIPLCLITCASVLAPNLAAAETFEAGSLVIPMDTDYQDLGVFEAFGLVYQLLLADVRVHWVIRPGKGYAEEDFTTSAVDLQTNAVIQDHGYRGGPWVIDFADSDAALQVITDWHAQFPTVAVHQTTEDFDGDVARTLVVAPTIAMLADGNQDIARKYMQAARIPDSVGDPLWPNTSPDMLDVGELSGPTELNHSDGALFDAQGIPQYCQLMSMHWGVNDAEADPEVVAEVRSFLSHPVHFFAECQAVNAFENLDPHGFFLTENGFEIGDRPDAYDFYQLDTPFVQFDGTFESVGGSEPAYTLPVGDMYKAQDIVLITEQGTPIGVNDVWMTGFIDGICPQSAPNNPGPVIVGPTPERPHAPCLTAGKVSYLGGHEYDVDVPISGNPQSQGARLFLNSLFEAPCATVEGLPMVTLEKTAPVFTADAEVTFVLDYQNQGPLPILDAVITDDLPAGSTFVSATGGGVLQGDTVTWAVGNLASGGSGSVDFTVTLPEFGDYPNVANIGYRVGLNDLGVDSNLTVTEYGEAASSSSGAASSGAGSSDASGDPEKKTSSPAISCSPLVCSAPL